MTRKVDRPAYVELIGLLRNRRTAKNCLSYGCIPSVERPRGRLWTAVSRRFMGDDGLSRAQCWQLVNAGVAIVEPTFLFQGVSSQRGESLEQTRVVPKWRECAGYTFLLQLLAVCSANADVLTIVRSCTNANVGSRPIASSVGVAGFGVLGRLSRPLAQLPGTN